MKETGRESWALDAIVCMNTGNHYFLWNAQAESLFGWKDAEVLGKPITETIIPESYQRDHEKDLNDTIRTDMVRMLNKLIEVYAKNKDTVLNFTNWNYLLFQYKPGVQVIFFCAFIRDISEEKKLTLKCFNNKSGCEPGT